MRFTFGEELVKNEARRPHRFRFLSFLFIFCRFANGKKNGGGMTAQFVREKTLSTKRHGGVTAFHSIENNSRRDGGMKLEFAARPRTS